MATKHFRIFFPRKEPPTLEATVILERSESVALAFVGVLETEGKPIGKPVSWLENHRKSLNKTYPLVMSK